MIKRDRFKHWAFIALCVLIPIVSFAQSVEKQKQIVRSFSAANVSSLKIDNQFGKIVVKNNNNNEVKVEINIFGKANSEEIAQQLVDRVSVKETGTPNLSFTTSLANQESSSKGNNQQKFSIDYLISVPPSLSLSLHNQFGAIEMNDYSGPLNVSSKFGSLTTGSVTNLTDMNVEFGKVFCKAINGKNADVSVKYSNGSIGEINGLLDLRMDYSNLKDLVAGKNLNGINIKANYGNINFNIADLQNVTFNIKTHFGKFINSGKLPIVSLSEKDDNEDSPYRPRFDEQYTGKMGNGAVKVDINSNFGNVKVTRTTTVIIINDNK